MALPLAVPVVSLDKGLGEKVHSVRSCQRDVWGDTRPVDGVVDYRSADECLAVLSEHSDGVVSELETMVLNGDTPDPAETSLGGTQRFSENLARLGESCCRGLGENVLVVAHGDTVDGAVRAFTEEQCYITQECCWVAFSFDRNTESVERIASSRMESMVLS